RRPRPAGYINSETALRDPTLFTGLPVNNRARGSGTSSPAQLATDNLPRRERHPLRQLRLRAQLAWSRYRHQLALQMLRHALDQPPRTHAKVILAMRVVQGHLAY